jgi:predicted nucleic acid-binding protein
MKLFLDANILFSASYTESNLYRLLQFLKTKTTLVTSDYAHTEALRNLHAKRTQWLQGFSQVMEGVEIVTSVDAPVPAQINDKDRPILATAIKHRCDILLTGDKRDFGHLYGQKVEETTVLSPLMLRDVLHVARASP